SQSDTYSWRRLTLPLWNLVGLLEIFHAALNDVALNHKLRVHLGTRHHENLLQPLHGVGNSRLELQTINSIVAKWLCSGVNPVSRLDQKTRRLLHPLGNPAHHDGVEKICVHLCIIGGKIFYSPRLEEI